MEKVFDMSLTPILNFKKSEQSRKRTNIINLIKGRNQQ